VPPPVRYKYSAEKDEADLVAKDIKFRADSVEFIALTIGKLQRIEQAIPGMFSVYNARAAIAAAPTSALSCRDRRSAEGVFQADGQSGSFQTGRDFTVIIDYAHTPDALEKYHQDRREVAVAPW
jgi:UDP-N-acetylmuramoyl-L-alanyl-D-glutamate--2,6-diaminopimelate ligase